MAAIMTEPYRIREAAIWAQARTDYLSGLSAEAVCRRHDLGLSAFRRRARKYGWRRSDQVEPPPGELDLNLYSDLDMDDLARTGDRDAIVFPRGMTGPRDAPYVFSFSGLKTAVARHLERHPDAARADVAAGFQEAVADVLTAKAVRAATDLAAHFKNKAAHHAAPGTAAQPASSPY